MMQNIENQGHLICTACVTISSQKYSINHHNPSPKPIKLTADLKSNQFQTKSEVNVYLRFNLSEEVWMTDLKNRVTIHHDSIS